MFQETVTIQYVKLHADQKEGKTLDISMYTFILNCGNIY